ncbi:hypothetical protein BH10CYA1_BH10CYA1_17700 [soil metagenome]
MANQQKYETQLPASFDQNNVGLFDEIDFRENIDQAEAYEIANHIEQRENDAADEVVKLAIIDNQVDFDLKEGRLTIFPAAVRDLINLLLFIFHNLRIISDIIVTLDNHLLAHIFSPIFWVSAADGKTHPWPGSKGELTAIFPDDVGTKWNVNPKMVWICLGKKATPENIAELQKYAKWYCAELLRQGKPPLVVWPVHCRLGSKGAALVPALMRAVDFFDVVRGSVSTWRVKGLNKLTEGYSPFGDEIKMYGKTKVGEDSVAVIQDLLNCAMLIIAGQALSHCVRAAIYDIMRQILEMEKAQGIDPSQSLTRKIYILVDASSPVPTFEKQAQDALIDFKNAGMNVVLTTTPIRDWPNLPKGVAAKIDRLAA